MVGCAHRLGLNVYLDVVVNHTADLSPLGRRRLARAGRKPYRDCRGRVFSPARYTGSRPFPCLRAATMPRPPFVLPADRTAQKPAWLNDTRRTTTAARSSSRSCSVLCYEQGDFFGLDDLFTEQAAVVNGLASVYASWIATLRSRRLPDRHCAPRRPHVLRALGAEDPRRSPRGRGEGVRALRRGRSSRTRSRSSAYVRDRGLPNSLDFPLPGRARPLRGRRRLGARDRRAARRRRLRRAANGVAPTPPTFLGNHDLGRAAQQLSAHAPASDRRAAAARPARPRRCSTCSAARRSCSTATRSG